MIARADTLEVFEAAIKNLKNSSYWNNQETLRYYISRYWLPIKHVSFIC